MASFLRSKAARLAFALTLAPGAGGAARAQFFFQPFGGVYRYDLPPPPPDDDERPRYATPRAVSRILARRGFELVSGLGRRGDQVVATGVSRRDGTVRFFIDPYEGEVIHAVRLAPPNGDAPAQERQERQERMDRPRGANQPPPEREAQRRPSRKASTGDPVAPAPAPNAAAPPQPAKPPETVTKVEPVRPTEPTGSEAVKPDAPKTEAAKPETRKAEAPKPEPKVDAAKPDDPPPVADRAAKDLKGAEAKAPGKSADAPRGVAGRRAIVAPKAKEGGAAMARPPAAPNATP